jgi:predicted phosphodiesterase
VNLAVISDLHLGRGDATEQFGHDDAHFLEFLKFLEGNFERIVLLGDIYETLTSRALRAQAQELSVCRSAHREVARRFDRPQYHFIHGNHDLVAGRLMRAPAEWTLEADGKRFLFTHGHGYDWLTRRMRWLSELSVWVGGWLLRIGLEPIHRLVDQLDHKLRAATIDPARCGFQRWAINLAKARGADVIVTGHTHLGAVTDHGGRIFANSGSCSGGRFSFLSLDTAREAYAVNASW